MGFYLVLCLFEAGFAGSSRELNSIIVVVGRLLLAEVGCEEVRIVVENVPYGVHADFEGFLQVCAFLLLVVER